MISIIIKSAKNYHVTHNAFYKINTHVIDQLFLDPVSGSVIFIA